MDQKELKNLFQSSEISYNIGNRESKEPTARFGENHQQKNFDTFDHREHKQSGQSNRLKNDDSEPRLLPKLYRVWEDYWHISEIKRELDQKDERRRRRSKDIDNNLQHLDAMNLDSKRRTSSPRDRRRTGSGSREKKRSSSRSKKDATPLQKMKGQD